MAMSVVASGTASAQALQVWAADPLTKVFKDDKPAAVAPGPMEVARGEVAEWQIVLRCDAELTGLKVSVGAWRGPKGTSLKKPAVRFVGYVPVDEGLPTPPKDRLRVPPCEFPDPLMVDAPKSVAAGVNQPVWLDLSIPKSAEPGEYEAEVRVTGKSGGKTVVAKLPIRLRVFGVTVGKSRLWVTNWFSTGSGHMPGSGLPGGKEEDAYLKLLAEKMAAHRQNVAIIAPLSLAKFSWGQDGAMKVDFGRFDTWVQIFSKAGVIGRIEGGHIGGRSSEAWESQFVVTIKTPEGDKSVAPDSPEADRFYSQYLPLLVKHLKEKRWASRYVQHLADEPIKANSGTYLKMAALVHKYAPGMKTIEATHTREVEGAIDVWVPQLNFAHTDFDYYKARQKKGEEFWTYTCVYPQGEYANRFIELPLVKTRILHWINFRYGITGYLHWGFNYWVKGDVFDDLTRTKAKDGWGGYLPAGDSWLVYPKDGRLLDSIRLEAMRDGIADYELLCMLGVRDAKVAQRLAEKIVLAFDRYETDVAAFRAVRRELLERLAE
jgi:hypothetical protein